MDPKKPVGAPVLALEAPLDHPCNRCSRRCRGQPICRTPKAGPLGSGGRPVRIDFQLPFGKTKVNEPLLATGHAMAGVVVFAHIIDERHIRIGADVWGGLFESDSIEVDFSQRHTVIVSDSALFPLDNPRVRRLSPDEASRLRSEIVVELDGKTVIEAAANCYESTVAEVLVGRAPFGSMTAPEFDGNILGYERLPVPQLLMLPASRHARMALRFPEGRVGLTEPLLSVDAGQDTCLCSVTYVSATRLRLSVLGSRGGVLLSKEIDYDPLRPHEFDFWPSIGNDANAPLMLSATFDATPVLGSRNHDFIGRVPILRTGLNPTRVPGVEARFTGPEMEMRLLSNTPLPEDTKHWGTAEIVLSFPLNKSGRHEPILTTGATGAGDFFYVVYEDSGHIRLGFDHWGGGAGALSDPLPIDYRVPHEIWISAAPLYPDLPGDPLQQRTGAEELKRLNQEVKVALDGKTVISLKANLYPSDPYQVTFAENKIGGSTADPSSRALHFLSRIPPPSSCFHDDPALFRALG